MFSVQLTTNDPAIVQILTDPTYGLPTRLPWGEYTPNATAHAAAAAAAAAARAL